MDAHTRARFSQTFDDSAADGGIRHSQRIVGESLLSSGSGPPSSLASRAYQ
ncbi:hypothetical protein [Myxococcus xanthus]|uniref:hypothetical protein n=1 Tax=Myxococcus xanthus TaxID=34 RepID=UPI00137631BD|nr:hypothetical protein [Myxococcus xanthus]